MLPPPFLPPVILPTYSWVDWLDCTVACEALRELIWVLLPLLDVCNLPPRARLRPRPSPRPPPRPRRVYPVFRSNADGSRRAKVSMRFVFVDPTGRPRRRSTITGSWIRSRGSIGGPGGSDWGRSNHQCSLIWVSSILSTEVALRCSCQWSMWQHGRPYPLTRRRPTGSWSVLEHQWKQRV